MADYTYTVRVGTYDIPQQFITDENYNWGLSLQQHVSQLEHLATPIHGIQGEDYKFSLVGGTDLLESSVYDSTGTTWTGKGRHQDIAIDELKTESGFMIKQDFHKHLAAQYDDAQQLGGIQQFTPKAVAALKSAVGRTIDQVILGVSLDATSSSDTYGKPILNTSSMRYKSGGIFGQNLRGLTVGTATRKTLSATATIASSTGGATSGAATGLNIEKVLAAKQELEERHVLDGGLGSAPTIVMLITPEMATQLIRDEERLGSSEYGFSALKTGFVTEIVGIKFVKTNWLPFIKESSVYVRRAVAYSPKSLLFGKWKDMNIEIKDQPGKVKTFTVGGYCSFGCAWEEEEAFVTVDSLTTQATVSSS